MQFRSRQIESLLFSAAEYCSLDAVLYLRWVLFSFCRDIMRIRPSVVRDALLQQEAFKKLYNTQCFFNTEKRQTHCPCPTLCFRDNTGGECVKYVFTVLLLT
ncbi:hypothetical protein F2P81_001740 [Scophthalmus maximus]|uniref:Uncharacterized protein n=1 Tax=Scophthalmus maximus TaxID=52904 RepID=A0A6A4TR23_SCOMX|nr:hypothetical protein F2P81_001740 [Scophthalmus maximus]